MRSVHNAARILPGSAFEQLPPYPGPSRWVQTRTRVSKKSHKKDTKDTKDIKDTSRQGPQHTGNLLRVLHAEQQQKEQEQEQKQRGGRRTSSRTSSPQKDLAASIFQSCASWPPCFCVAAWKRPPAPVSAPPPLTHRTSALVEAPAAKGGTASHPLRIPLPPLERAQLHSSPSLATSLQQQEQSLPEAAAERRGVRTSHCRKEADPSQQRAPQSNRDTLYQQRRKLPSAESHKRLFDVIR